MKRIVAFCLAVTLLLSVMPWGSCCAAEANSGMLGGSVFWRLDFNTGTLRISGRGEIGSRESKSDYPWYQLRKNVQKLIVEDGITNIPAYAFRNCEQLSTVWLPQSVTRIEDGAFMECDSLESIVLPRGLKSIGYEAFRMCQNLKKVYFPEGLRTIGSWAFFYCEALEAVDLPESLKEIGFSAFGDCASLLEVELPEGLETLEGSVFGECSSLRFVSLPQSLTCINGGMFYGCSALEEIELPENLQEIDYSAFERCTGLLQIDIPQTVKTIGDEAFYGCSSLKRVGLPQGLTRIGESAFEGCSALRTIDLPQSLEDIGMTAFSGCTSLTELVLPENLQVIREGLCYGCTGLERLVLPRRLKSIDIDAFMNCEKLSRVENYSLRATVGRDAFWGSAVSVGIRLHAFLQTGVMKAVPALAICLLLLWWQRHRAKEARKRFWDRCLGVCGMITTVYFAAILIARIWLPQMAYGDWIELGKMCLEYAGMGAYGALAVFGIGAYQYFVGGAWLRAAEKLPRLSVLAQALVLGVNLFVLGGLIRMAWQTQQPDWPGGIVVHEGCFVYFVKWTSLEYFMVPIAGIVFGWAALLISRYRAHRRETE